MKAVNLAKSYDPASFEGRIYEKWLQSGAFKPHGEGKPFVIVIPPPNVTGVLHMGHGLNDSLQDTLIRYHRMTGRPTLWVPGTDHAGIATQNVVERKLKKQGIRKDQIGREKFLEETWTVVHDHHTTITEQTKRLGASCDWDRERFTFDEGLSRAVREVFVGLYERKLLYKGKYLVNWCPRCGTALADDEVDYKEVKGRMYHIRYPFADGEGGIGVATTRPETMLGDTAVAVHPEDARYAATVGRSLKLPLTGRTIPVIADAYVEKDFGSGAVKITPGHDPNDYEIGKRHELAQINILNPNGTLNDDVPERYRGLEVKKARELVVEDLQAQGFLEKIDDHVHQVGHCYRCDAVVEPFLSEQWFVRMRPLADKALGAWERGEVRFFPKKWENTYTHWLRGIRDWCISRQLWWGHRIPVWYCDSCGHMMVVREDPRSCAKCGGEAIRQDEDVLDTWFSSWLWPFSTLGWPEKTPDLKAFFPTSTLVTAYDIIFFWVARMIMASMEFMGEVPFRDVLITGLIRDKQGRKMSKSLGNGIDPLEVVAEFGSDALRFTMVFLAAQGQDIPLDKESFKIGSKFANKIWNAARFLLMNLEGRELLPLDRIVLKDTDKWILHRLNDTIVRVRASFEEYRFNDAAQACYEFFWNEFCDWYVEASKISMNSNDDAEKDRAASLLILVLDEALRMLHPLLPFVTEEIYQSLPGAAESIMSAPYPTMRSDREYPAEAAGFAAVQELVRLVRTLRSEFTIPPDRKIKVRVRSDADYAQEANLRKQAGLVRFLVNSEDLDFASGSVAADFDTKGSVPIAGTGFEVRVYVKDLVDAAKETEKLKKEIDKATAEIERTEVKLSNEEFRSRAPADIIAKEREKQEELGRKIRKMRSYIRDLGD